MLIDNYLRKPSYLDDFQQFERTSNKLQFVLWPKLLSGNLLFQRALLFESVFKFCMMYLSNVSTCELFMELYRVLG